MTLAGFYNWAGWFESYLVKNPEDRFSREEAQIVYQLWKNNVVGMLIYSYRTNIGFSAAVPGFQGAFVNTSSYESVI